ncbi:MAG: beta-ketoacyl-[acyl-carrier-protein] synthase family protein [Planctomyces sp.]|nr:beta-ketoacyl-[acyl-carrier-protein] synthase family protein [Planctomyces sp.]
MSTDSYRSRQVVITGLGILSPCGIGREAFWNAIRERRSGVAPVEQFECSNVSRGIGGEVKDFNDETIKKVYLKDLRKSLKVMSRDIQMAAAAASLALAESGIRGTVDPERIGVEYGANLIFSPPEDLQDACWACTDDTRQFHFERWGENGFAKMEPLWMLKYLPNMPACHIAIYADARGPSNSLTLDEASSNVVLTESLRILRRGAADAMITGATGTRLHPIRAMHARLWDAIGTADDPGRSCRPFDAHRNGQAIGEGAGCMILEEEAHARARGVRIYGRLLGGGSSCALDRDGRPRARTALVNAMRSALEDAGLAPGDIGHISAHGTGDVASDHVEAEAIWDVFGDLAGRIPVAGLKGYTGNSGAGCGTLEAAASLLAAAEGVAPPTLNCEEPDPACRLNVTQDFVPVASKTFLKINFTRAGQASATVFEALAP